MLRKGVWPRRILTLIVCAGLVAAAMMVVPGPSIAQQPKTLKIGYLMELTGWYSILDANEERYIKATASIINDRGGITVGGQKYLIELVGEDGKTTLDGNTAAAQKLVFDHKVKFVVGPSGFFGTGSSPTFEQNKVLHVSGYNTCQPGEMDATTPYGFLGYNSSIGHLVAALKATKKEFPNVKKFVIATPDDGAVPYLMPVAKKIVAEYGFQVVGEPVPYPNEMEDYSPVAAKLNAVKEADAVLFVNGTPVHFGQTAKYLRSLGNKKPIAIGAALAAEDIASISGKPAANDIVTMAITPHAKGNPPMLDEAFDRAGKKMPALCFMSNCLVVLTKVIEAANSLDPDKVKAKWESMEGVEGFYGMNVFGGDKTFGLKHHAVGHPQPYQKLVKGEVVYGGWVDVGRIP